MQLYEQALVRLGSSTGGQLYRRTALRAGRCTGGQPYGRAAIPLDLLAVRIAAQVFFAEDRNRPVHAVDKPDPCLSLVDVQAVEPHVLVAVTAWAWRLDRAGHLAVGETLILLTPLQHPY